MHRPVCDALLAKIHEQIDRSDHLLSLIPDDRLDWVPAVPGAWPLSLLLGHLLECLAGFCAVFHALRPEQLAHFATLRDLPVNRDCNRDEAREHIRAFAIHIDEGFAAIADNDLEKRLPTIFVAEGESLMTLLLGNLEHLVNHKHQLFMYLKEMGLPVSSRDLYRFR